MCERCKNPNITEVETYTIRKGHSQRKIVLCEACAEITRAAHSLTGGKAPEAKPSEPGPEVREESASPDDDQAVVNDKPARKRRY